MVDTVGYGRVVKSLIHAASELFPSEACNSKNCFVSVISNKVAPAKFFIAKYCFQIKILTF